MKIQNGEDEFKRLKEERDRSKSIWTRSKNDHISRLNLGEKLELRAD